MSAAQQELSDHLADFTKRFAGSISVDGGQLCVPALTNGKSHEVSHGVTEALKMIVDLLVSIKVHFI